MHYSNWTVYPGQACLHFLFFYSSQNWAEHSHLHWPFIFIHNFFPNRAPHLLIWPWNSDCLHCSRRALIYKWCHVIWNALLRKWYSIVDPPRISGYKDWVAYFVGYNLCGDGRSVVSTHFPITPSLYSSNFPLPFYTSNVYCLGRAIPLALFLSL